MVVSVEYATEHFDDLATAVDGGESVEITRPDKPVLQLVLSNSSEKLQQVVPKVLGAGKGEMRVPSWVEWKEMDKDWRESFSDKFGLDKDAEAAS